MAENQTLEVALLQGLLSADNDVRTQAESTYDSFPDATKVPFLIKALRDYNLGQDVRTMAAVLLRRLVTSKFDDFWPEFPPELQNMLKEQLILGVQEDPEMSVRRKICDAAAELGRNMLDDNGNNTWPEILKFMFDWASSPDPRLRESALHIFGAVPGVFGNQQTQYVEVIKQMLHQCLTDQANHQVRFAAVKATTAFLLANEKEVHVLHHFRDLLPIMIQSVRESIQRQEDDTLIKCLIDMAEDTPKYLRHQLDAVLSLCLEITSKEDLQESWRHLGLEVIVTLSETAPAMVRKFDKFLTQLVPIVLSLMVDLEEDEEWSTSDEIEEEDSDTNAIAGESALDRLACGLGGKAILPQIVSNIPQMLSNPDWRYRHAALMAISACGEGCHKQMEPVLDNILDAVLPYLSDQHPRVRYAACNALGQMSTDFGPLFQKKFHGKVIPGLLMVMDDNQNPRVQSHAGAALVNFSEECPKTILTPYLDTIISKLEGVLTAKFKELLEKGTKLVLEQVVTTLAAVADAAEEKFVHYYDRFMPCLKYIVENANQQELRLLRGKTIECISLIGLAVGRDKFMQDCSDVMQLLLKTQMDQEEMAEDDPQMSYMISAWARMCKIMGRAFEQYLPLVMGPVLKAAAIKPEVALVDNEDMKALEGDTDWQFVTLGDQQSFGIRTAGLEEKATACQMLVCYARELKEGFAAYTEEVVKIMVPLLRFYFHDGVRAAAAESLPFLLECAKIRGPEYVTQMWQYVCPELLKAVSTEPENDLKSEHMHALAQCVELMGQGCLGEGEMKELVDILNKLMEEHFDRQLARQEKRKDEDYDEVVEESLLDEDDEDVYILSKVSDIMHSLFGTHKENILPVFEQLLPQYVKLLGAERPWPDRQWSLCIFDDLIEHTGPHSVNYQQYFLQRMLESICDKQGEVRQAAAYGIGVMAQHGGEAYAQACQEAVAPLLKVIQEPSSRNEENVNPTENAISAITKICKYNHGNINVDELLPVWLGWLPVWEDEEEAVHVYNYLCDLIEINHPKILGDNNANLPRLLSIIAEAFVRDAVDSEIEVGKRLVNIIRQIQTNEGVFQACLGQLTVEQQQSISAVLATS